MTLKVTLAQYLENVNPKQFGTRLASNPDLKQQLADATAQYNPKNISEQVYIILNGAPVPNACGKLPLFNTFALGYRKFCGSKAVCDCAKQQQSAIVSNRHTTSTAEQKQRIAEKKRATCLQKYGAASPLESSVVKEKIKQTNLHRYGVETPFQSAAIQDQIKQHNLNTLGVEFPLQSAQVRAKGISTTIERHGSLMSQARAALFEKYDGNPFAHPAVKEKIKQSLQQRYNRSSPKHMHLFDEQLSVLQDRSQFEALLTNKTFALAAQELGVNDTTIGRYCEYYDLRNVKAPTKIINEHFIKTILDELGVNYIQNTKSIIAPYELDFYLPEHAAAIEVGSIWHHSELNGKRGKFYHWNKWVACSAAGISLYQWFDDELRTSPEVIKNKIQYITGNIKNRVGARLVSVGSVSVAEERLFLDTNHIQQFSSDRQYVFGGYYDSELVAVMAFKRRDEQDDIELTRYATKLRTNYPGLFTKMFKHACIHLPDRNIISFSANCHSNGNLYKASGFEQSHIVKPTYFYTKNYHSKEGRYQYIKKRLLEKYPSLDHTKTEWQLMQELGYDRIWDAGKIAWVFERS